MKFELDWGSSWRGTFKKLLWFSVIVFEITAVGLIWFVVTKFMPQTEVHAISIILFSLIATLLNIVIHCVWGCIAYLFEDIARTREVNCAMAEYILERDKKLHPELEEAEKSAASANSGVTKASSNGAAYEHKVYRSVSERNKDHAPAAETWICPACGTPNAAMAAFCKDCGKYK